jgi:hypothetical protein
MGDNQGSPVPVLWAVDTDLRRATLADLPEIGQLLAGRSRGKTRRRSLTTPATFSTSTARAGRYSHGAGRAFTKATASFERRVAKRLGRAHWRSLRSWRLRRDNDLGATPGRNTPQGSIARLGFLSLGEIDTPDGRCELFENETDAIETIHRRRAQYRRAPCLLSSSNSKAIDKASDAQAAATKEATQLQRDVYNKNVGFQTPYLNTGNAAMAQINALLGLNVPQSRPNPRRPPPNETQRPPATRAACSAT